MSDQKGEKCESLSRSKLKRLNRKAKVERIEKELTKEKRSRASAEKQSETWKMKALASRSQLNAYRAKRLTEASTTTMQSQRPLSMIAAAMNSSVLSLPKATPLPVKAHKAEVSSVPTIRADELVCPGSGTDIGSGRFGSCSRMVFKDAFEVCVKTFDMQTSLGAMRYEASIMLILNSSKHTPHCFGICVELRAIVMMNIKVESQQVSLFNALISADGFTLNAESSKNCLANICDGLSHMHKMDILHNDLKLDNIVIGTTYTGLLKAFIVDFGKACKFQHVKKYNLSEDEKTMYKKEHTQVAPDLRDGLVPQSVHSDIFSLGRIIKRVNSRIIRSTILINTTKQCLSYHGHNRPSLESIVHAIVS